MVVAPSIVFYVLENGGTREQYGIILSAFSFSSFCAKPFVGFLSDQYGFRAPYMVCLFISALGGFVYMIASAFYGTTAVVLMLLGRLLGGVGAASAALGFAYLAKSVPHQEQTKTNSLLSMTRIIGMTTGPGLNVLLAEIDVEWFGFKLDPLNSVGLILIGANLLALLSIVLLLEEPKDDLTAPNYSEVAAGGGRVNRLWAIVRSLWCIDILVPIFSIFAFNANFQLIETALAPAASHGMGWTPVGVSTILGSVSIIIFINMLIVFYLSARKVRDEHMLLFGSTLSTTGYFSVWYLWRWEAEPWEFVLPIILGVSSFPFLAAPTRSIFTKAVDGIEILDNYQGSMQALLSMFASLAGFTTPGLVAAYILREPEEVEESSDHRELSPFALVAPCMSALMLLGNSLVLIRNIRKEQATLKDGEDVTVDESTQLVTDDQKQRRRTTCYRTKRFSTRAEVDRRRSTLCMGMVQPSMLDEYEMHANLDFIEEDED